MNDAAWAKDQRTVNLMERCKQLELRCDYGAPQPPAATLTAQQMDDLHNLCSELDDDNPHYVGHVRTLRAAIASLERSAQSPGVTRFTGSEIEPCTHCSRPIGAHLGANLVCPADQPAGSEWQPIETAPRNGNFQVCLETCPHLSWPAHADAGNIYSNAHGLINKPDEYGRITTATHWRPAHSPPTNPAQPPKVALSYSQACALLAAYAVAQQDRHCCGDEMQPEYMAALKACTDAMGVLPPTKPAVRAIGGWRCACDEWNQHEDVNCAKCGRAHETRGSSDA
jgi:hypothetical protein